VELLAHDSNQKNPKLVKREDTMAQTSTTQRGSEQADSLANCQFNLHIRGMFPMRASIIYIVVGALIMFGLVPQAKSACTSPNSILNGTYGWQGEALTTSGNSPNPKIGDYVPLVQNGHLTFDGNGNFSGAHDTNLGGELIPHVDSGTYSVNSDCITGTITFATGVGFTMSFVITSGGQEIKYVSATTGGVNFGTLRPVGAPCTAGTLSGNSYGYSSHGLIASGKGNGFPRVGGFVPFSDAGQILFAADGSISGTDNQNLGGVVIPGQTIAGTYTVNSDCTGSTTMTIAGVDQSWHFVILQGADQIIFLATPSGVVWGGTLTKE
jgi:hypothetical protein